MTLEPGHTGEGAAEQVQRGARTRVMAVASIVFVLGAVVLAVVALGPRWNDVMSGVTTIGPIRVALSALAVVAGVVASCRAWRLCLEGFGASLGRRDAARIFYPTQLGKYMPGGVWTFIGQVALAKRYGLSRSQITLAGTLFLGIHVVTGGVIALPLLVGSALSGWVGWAGWLLILGAAAVVLHPPVLTWVLRRTLALMGRELAVVDVQRRSLAMPAAWLAITWASYGAATALLVGPLADAGTTVVEVAVLSTGGFAAAWVVGLVVLIAPAGLGAREVVLVAALAPMIGGVRASSVAIVVRVLHTGTDFLLAGLSGTRRRDRHRAGPPGDVA